VIIATGRALMVAFVAALVRTERRCVGTAVGTCPANEGTSRNACRKQDGQKVVNHGDVPIRDFPNILHTGLQSDNLGCVGILGGFEAIRQQLPLKL
jgi:hypothetical protein